MLNLNSGLSIGKQDKIYCTIWNLKNLQKGKCKHCGLILKEDDILEIDYFLTKNLAGKERKSNINFYRVTITE